MQLHVPLPGQEKARLLIGDISLPERAGWHAKAKDLGYMQAPVVLVLDLEGNIIDHWSGFRPDKLEEYSEKAKAETQVLELAAA